MFRDNNINYIIRDSDSHVSINNEIFDSSEDFDYSLQSKINFEPVFEKMDMLILECL